MEPVIVTSHNVNGNMHHIAWSSYHFHQNMLNVHPLANPNHQNLINRIQHHIIEQQMDPFEYSYTDFHCTTLLNNRGPLAYFCIINDHIVSPIFFTVIEINNYVIQHPNHPTIYVADHNYL
jgi:Fe-S cluster biosynthesis and repair protein YggX